MVTYTIIRNTVFRMVQTHLVVGFLHRRSQGGGGGGGRGAYLPPIEMPPMTKSTGILFLKFLLASLLATVNNNNIDYQRAQSPSIQLNFFNYLNVMPW